MISIRKQKAKARRSREIDSLSDFDKMDVILGDGRSNPIEQQLAITINGSVGHKTTDAFSSK